MTYRPAEEFFGVPWRARFFALLHLVVALLLLGFVFFVQRGPTDSELYRYMFQRAHFIDTHTLVWIVLLSALASLLREGMRGVRVRGDFLEYRDVVGYGWPQVKKIRWAQIDELSFEANGAIGLSLWDGRWDFLPRVADPEGLTRVLTRVARARAIPMQGNQLSHEWLEEEE